MFMTKIHTPAVDEILDRRPAIAELQWHLHRGELALQIPHDTSALHADVTLEGTFLSAQHAPESVIRVALLRAAAPAQRRPAPGTL